MKGGNPKNILVINLEDRRIYKYVFSVCQVE